MGILKEVMLIRCLPVKKEVTQTNDPMGILKARGSSQAAGGVFGYTDQRSDGDTESPLVGGGSSTYAAVTQTNDPMGILKDLSTQQ